MHSDALDTYAKIREYIEQYLINNKNVWKRPQGSQFGLTKVANKVDDGPVPMDIGAVKGDKGAGKDGKGKGDKGKWKSGKGKGKQDEHHDWSKDKWKRDDKGKAKDLASSRLHQSPSCPQCLAIVLPQFLEIVFRRLAKDFLAHQTKAFLCSRHRFLEISVLGYIFASS